MAQSESPRTGRSFTSDNGKGRGRAVGVTIGLTLLALIFSAIIGILFAIPMFLLGFDFQDTPVLVFLLIGGQVGFFVAGYLYVRRYGLPVPVTRPDRRDLTYAAGGVVAALVFATVAAELLGALGFMPQAVLEQFVMEDPMIAIWMALLSVVVVAPAEEYLFRGVIQGRLRQTFSAPSAIIIASLLFASLHFANFIGSLGTVIGWTLLITGVGVVFGFLYEQTNSLTVPIIAHAAYNVILFTVGYLML